MPRPYGQNLGGVKRSAVSEETFLFGSEGGHRAGDGGVFVTIERTSRVG